MLAYNIVEEMEKERTPEDPTLEEDIKKILRDFDAGDISEVQVIENRSLKILGTSHPSNQGVVGQRTTKLQVKQSMVLEEDQSSINIDEQTGHRIWVLSTPIKSGKKVIGAIYLVAKIENAHRLVFRDPVRSGVRNIAAVHRLEGVDERVAARLHARRPPDSTRGRDQRDPVAFAQCLLEEGLHRPPGLGRLPGSEVDVVEDDHEGPPGLPALHLARSCSTRAAWGPARWRTPL